MARLLYVYPPLFLYSHINLQLLSAKLFSALKGLFYDGTKTRAKNRTKTRRYQH